ncbi:hypothetical protein ACHQM5_015513 [Ranunculus cassubicifolius]
MLRDLKFFRRNVGKNPGNVEIENVPPVECSVNPVSNHVSRAPLNVIPEPMQNPKCGTEEDLSYRKMERTPTKGQGKGAKASWALRTPEKQVGFSSRNKFGWAQKNEGGISNTETRDEGKSDVKHLPPSNRGSGQGHGNGGLPNMTPRSVRSVGRGTNNHSECSSTQSTPTKSVTKPPNPGFASLNGSRPAINLGSRTANFSALTKGVPTSCASPLVVNTTDVPHFDLREDPSFWMDHNVQVLIRVRPLNSMERSSYAYSRCLKQESAQSIAWIGQPETRFTFDHVACETVNQDMLFRVAGLPMVENCLSGYNSCMFAFGQTGSGKTYTMLGEIGELEVKPSPDRGMTPRIFEFLFARIRAEEESRRDEKLQYHCKCSFLEIYNEQITDLLDPSSTNLLLREDINKGVYVENLTEYEVHSVNDILKLLTEGAANRKVAATNMNRESSRSHSVFTCVIESKWEKDSTTNLRFARLNLVDLAGSERQKTSGAEGERLKEAANINKSLSTLGHVIMLLVDVAHGKLRHIPYRDSRLTFLLQESLGGNSKTMIIANVSPSICCAAETLSTLKFAQRAKLIQNNAVINEDASGDVSALQHQIQLLKEELSILKHRNVSRSLSFHSASLEDTDGEGPEGYSNGTSEMAHDSADDDCQTSGSLGIMRVSNQQLKSLEATLAGALRRELMADTCIKQLEAEIEQLNRLVNQREEDIRCSKMMLKFREDKIQKLESGLDGSAPSDTYLLEENNILSKELELLRAKIDRNPEVTRFALENIRLLDKLRRFQDFYEEGEREMLLAEVSELRTQLLRFLDGNNEHNHLNTNLSHELEKTNEELEQCRNKLNSCLENNTQLTRQINDLHFQLNILKSSNHEQDAAAKTIKEARMEVQAFENHVNESVHEEMVKWKHEAIMKHTEEIMTLHLELDILNGILEEERSSRREIEERALTLGIDLEVAKARCLEMSMHCEATEKKLKDSISVTEALESQQIQLISELEDLKNSNSHYLDLVKKQEYEVSSLREQICCQDLRELSSLERSENNDSDLQVKLNRMQYSLEKAKKLNTWYQSDQVCKTSHEQEMDEVRRQVEAETAEVIICLQEELTNLQQQVKDCDGKEIEAKERLLLLESELKEMKEKFDLMMQDYNRLNVLVLEKDEEMKTLSEEWERLACGKDIEAKERLLLLESELKEMKEKFDSMTQDNNRLNVLVLEKDEEMKTLSEEWERLTRGKEIEAKEHLLLLESELKEIKEKFDLMTHDNNRLNVLVLEKDEEMKKLSEGWERLACEKEIEAKERLLLLESELKETNEKFDLITQDNNRLNAIVLEKDEEMKTLSERWERLACEIEEAMDNGHEALEDASDQLNVITSSLPPRTRIHEQVRRILRNISDKESMIEELQRSLEDAQTIKAEMEWKLLSLRGAALAINEAQQQESIEKEKEIQSLRREVEVSEESCLLLKQRLSEEEERVHLIERKLEDVEKEIVMKTREKLDELKLGVSTLNLCMNEYVEQVGVEKVEASGNKDCGHVDSDPEGTTGIMTSPDIDKKEFHALRDYTNNITKSSFEIDKAVPDCPSLGRTYEDTYNRDLTIHLLRKEIESALESLKGVQAQMIKLLEEKEEISNSEKQSKKSMECFSTQLVALHTVVCGSEEVLQLKITELEHKLLKLEESTAAAKVSCLQKNEVFDLQLSDAKLTAMQKTAEATNLIAKFEEAQETMKEADVMVNALVIANDTSKLEIERLNEMAVKLTKERDYLTNEVQTLQLSINRKDQLFGNLEDQYKSDLSDTRSLILTLEDIIAEMQSSFTEQFESILCDFQCMKSQILQCTNLTWSSLEDIWSEIIIKDCAVSVLHLCHMGVLLEAVNGLNVENGLLHLGICESNSVISNLKDRNSKAAEELEMLGIIKGKLLVDFKNSFNRISRKEDEARELSSKLSSFEKKILDLQIQEELMVARSNSMGVELAHIVEELDLHKTNALAVLSDQIKHLRDKEESATSQVELLKIDLAAKDYESLILGSELFQTGLQKANLESERETYTMFLEDIKQDIIFLCVDAELKNCLLMDTQAEVSLLTEVIEETNSRLLEVEQEKKDVERGIQSLKEVTSLNEKLKSELAELMETKDRLTARVHFLETETEMHIKGGITKETVLKASICELERELDQKDTKLNKLSSIEMENEKLKIEAKKLNAYREEVLYDLHEKKSEVEISNSRLTVLDEENRRLQERVCSMEDSIVILQSECTTRNGEVEELRFSKSIMTEELSAKIQDLETKTNIISSLKEKNDSLRSEVISAKQTSETLVSLISSDIQCFSNLSQDVDSAQNGLFQLLDGKKVTLLEKMFQDLSEHKRTASSLIKECEGLESCIEELISENLSFQAELLRKDEVLKGLLFDLSLLQESASNAKDQKDEIVEMAAAVKSLEDDLALRIVELDEAVVCNQILEDRLQEKLNRFSGLELDLLRKCESLQLLTSEKVDLQTQLEDVSLLKGSLDEELKERNKELERLEEENFLMENDLGQMYTFLEGLKNDLDKVTCERDRLKSDVHVLEEKLEQSQALAEEKEALAVEAQEIAESRKTYAEDKEEEVKLLETSVEELESTVGVLENKVSIIKEEAERQRSLREELETELQVIKNQMMTVTTPDLELQRHLEEKDRDLHETQEHIKALEKSIAEKDVQISQCRAHISELNLHAEAQAHEYKQKFKALEAMAEQVKPDISIPSHTNSSSGKQEKNTTKPRGSGSPFKCIGLGISHQINSEKDQELASERLRIKELEALSASRQKEIFMLNARLAAAESMTHDVIRDLLGVKLDMNNYASLLDHQQGNRIAEKAAHIHSEESSSSHEVIIKLKQQVNHFVEERQGWLDEISQKDAQIMETQIGFEKLQQQEQFLSTSNEMLKKEITSHKKKVMQLEDEVKKLSGQQNLQQRIHHHAKIKAKNNILKSQNEELLIKVRRAETLVSRMKEELACYRAKNGGFNDFDKLKKIEEEKVELAEKLLSLCTSILEVAGMRQVAPDVCVYRAEEALERLKDRIISLEREVHDMRLKNKVCGEKIRLYELKQQAMSPISLKKDENGATTPQRSFQSSLFTSLNR